MKELKNFKQRWEKKCCFYEGHEWIFHKCTLYLKQKIPVLLQMQLYLCLGNGSLQPVFHGELPEDLTKELMLPNKWEVIPECKREIQELETQFQKQIPKGMDFDCIHGLFFCCIDGHLMECQVNAFGKVMREIPVSMAETPLLYLALHRKGKDEIGYQIGPHHYFLFLKEKNKTLCLICDNKDCLTVLNAFTVVHSWNGLEVVLDEMDANFLHLQETEVKDKTLQKISQVKGVAMYGKNDTKSNKRNTE